MTELERLKAAYEVLSDDLYKFDNKYKKKQNKKLSKLTEDEYSKIDFSKEYNDWCEARQPMSKLLSDIGRDIRFIDDYILGEIPSYGDKMTLKTFIGCCKSGGFINYDGYGHYATKNKVSNIEIYPTDIKYDRVRTDFTHVIWYNR